jgi:Ca2+-transporting ATPase
MVPSLHSVFQVQTLTWKELWVVYGFAALNLPAIQLMKWGICRMKRKEVLA